ncbi:CTP synthase [Candidatus Mycoplasma pogonae]
MSKYIFVTGGVISGLGKGVAAASIGNILKARGYKIFVLKLDPYLNVDPGVISPYEHGEVYVTGDGGETDLDLGHYERFIDENFTKDSNYTSGKIFAKILDNERKGKYNGKTVQFIPHVTNEIKNIITNIEKKYQVDFVIVEIGGTVGDIESNPFVYSLAEMRSKNPQDVFFIHVTYVPFLSASNDFKTKPTQNSIRILNSMGIQPNIILLRADNDIANDIIEKVAYNAFLPKSNVISMPNLKSIYDVPGWLESRKTAEIIQKYFGFKNKTAKLDVWYDFAEKAKQKHPNKITIGMIGKYVEFIDAYKSIVEALLISGIYKNVKINLKWIESSKITSKTADKILKNLDGVMILPGFGIRGFEGKVTAAIYTREKDIPTFGICLGMQAMSVAQARLKGYSKATSAEFAQEEDDEVYVLDLIDNKAKQMGGTLRLGNYDIQFTEDSLLAEYYETNKVIERHRHRYEITKKFQEILPDGDFDFSGINPASNLVEACEMKSKKFYIGTQYHPEFTARPLKPHKLFNAFIDKTLEYKLAKKVK